MRYTKSIPPGHRRRGRALRGFTLAELLVGSSVMLAMIIGTLSLYMRSNKVSVDQSMYAEIQHDVRSAMYFISRDIRMSGVGLPIEFGAYYFQGTNNETQGSSPVTPDRLLMMGNIEDPICLPIRQYQGASVVVSVDDYSFEQFPYPDDFYANKICLILPNPASPCRAGEIRQITHVTHNTGGTNERVNCSPGLAPGINPPGGLSGTCPDSDNYDGGLVTFIDVKEFWLDLTGSQSGPTMNAAHGYIAQPNVLYMTLNAVHYPLAQNVENLQFEYNTDADADGRLDGFVPWNNLWTQAEIMNIREIRVSILGRTPRPFVSASTKTEATPYYIYQRPPVSDTLGAAQPDRCKRFLLESSSNVRNLSLNLYNTGTR